jgi:hypothetical protein
VEIRERRKIRRNRMRRRGREGMIRKTRERGMFKCGEDYKRRKIPSSIFHFFIYWSLYFLLLNSFFFFFAFSRVQTGSAFFVSLSISPKGDCFGLTFGFGFKFYGWMPFALNLCYFFSKGNSGWYTPRLKSPSWTKLVYSLCNVPQPD